MVEGRGGSFFKNLVLGASSIAALGGAYEAGKSTGQESGYTAGELKEGNNVENSNKLARVKALDAFKIMKLGYAPIQIAIRLNLLLF